MRAKPGEGWDDSGIYRIAHERALEGDYRRCITIKDENEQYELLFRKEVNRIIIRGEKYEALKAKSREKRRADKERRDAVRAEKEKEAMERAEKLDAEIKVNAQIKLEMQRVQREKSIQEFIARKKQEALDRCRTSLTEHLSESFEENEGDFESESAWDVSSDIIFEDIAARRQANE